MVAKQIKSVPQPPAAKSYDAKTAATEVSRSTEKRVVVEKKASVNEAVVVNLQGVLSSTAAEGLFGASNLSLIRERLNTPKKGEAQQDIERVDFQGHADLRWKRESVELLVAMIGDRHLFVTGPWAAFSSKELEMFFQTYTPYARFKSVTSVANENELTAALNKAGIESYVIIEADRVKPSAGNTVYVDPVAGLMYRDAQAVARVFDPDTSERLNSPSRVQRVG